MPDLLLELASEEIPARLQARAAEDLRRLVTGGLVEAGLTYAQANAHATPRRLALAVEGLTAASEATREERKGPRTDAPDAAIEGFLRSTGLARGDLEVRTAGKSEAFFAVTMRPGRPAAGIVAEVVPSVVRAFPWPVSMRWGTGSLAWIRPLTSILCVMSDDAGAEVVPFEIEGIRSGDRTAGHPFMAPERFSVASFDDYEAKLRRAFVLLDAEERQERIRADAATAAFATGLEVVPDEGLLAELAGLVEWPVVLAGPIDAAYLELPAEVLQTSMRTHQKFLALRRPATGKIERFVTVANRETADDGATILAGNRRVLAARLADAAFFWENDLREVAAQGLEEMAAKLLGMTFHVRLGDQGERTRRIALLAAAIAPAAGADPEQVGIAAKLCKADLVSAMVGEFPELQGIMGGYYAAAEGRPPPVCRAIAEHYRPLGPSDRLPEGPVSVTVALADKLDTLAAFWAIGEMPTGSRDPYALRRAGLGAIRILAEANLRLPLRALLAEHIEAARLGDPAVAEALVGFLHDRLKVWLRERGIRHDVIDACLALPGADDLALLVRRAEALAAFLATPDGTNLLIGFRRANNILTAEETRDGVEYSLDPNPKFAETDAERALFAALDAAEAATGPALAADDFATAMTALAILRAPVDAFFETVQVNAPSQILRRNRLCLLHRIRAVCREVADLSLIEG